LDRNADLSQIGAVLSVLPIAFLIVLLFLAAFADRVGWSHIFILVNWSANFFSNFVYYVATALPAFFVAFSFMSPKTLNQQISLLRLTHPIIACTAIDR